MDTTPVEPAPSPQGAAPPPLPAPPARGSRARNLGAAALVVALAVASFSLGRVSTSDTEPVSSSTATTMAPASTIPAGEEPVAAVAAALTPSMVQIQTQNGLGSGVIYDRNGLILTAAHVVGTTERALVQLSDGAKVEGTVIGADPNSDIAVVKIDSEGLQAAPLALDEPLQPGRIAIAIGSPFGLDSTVTSGVISSVARAIPGSDGVVRELIQTDAPINPGNSGGALADREGRVIGINDQIFSTSGGNEGVGFAIPIGQAKEIADRLVAGEPIQTAKLGVSGTEPTIGEAGALITGIEPDTGASAAGLAVGDLVVAVDGSPVQSITDLAGVVRTKQPGDVIRLTVHRGGTSLDLDVTLTSR